jgi:class 3 adenylate cyclase
MDKLGAQTWLGRQLHAADPHYDTPKIERRLAAIMEADVAGYSRLMGTDEVGTLNALKEHRRNRMAGRRRTSACRPARSVYS